MYYEYYIIMFQQVRCYHFEHDLCAVSYMSYMQISFVYYVQIHLCIMRIFYKCYVQILLCMIMYRFKHVLCADLSM